MCHSLHLSYPFIVKLTLNIITFTLKSISFVVLGVIVVAVGLRSVQRMYSFSFHLTGALTPLDMIGTYS